MQIKLDKMFFIRKSEYLQSVYKKNTTSNRFKNITWLDGMIEGSAH